MSLRSRPRQRALLIGGRAIWTVPGTFVAIVAVGGLVGWSGVAVAAEPTAT